MHAIAATERALRRAGIAPWWPAVPRAARGMGGRAPLRGITRAAPYPVRTREPAMATGRIGGARRTSAGQARGYPCQA